MIKKSIYDVLHELSQKDMSTQELLDKYWELGRRPYDAQLNKTICAARKLELLTTDRKAYHSPVHRITQKGQNAYQEAKSKYDRKIL